MKKLFFIFLTLALSGQLNAQTKDNFIRIVGNSKAEYQAEGLLLTLNISEIQPNEYQKIRYKPIEVVYQNFVANLVKLGYKESDLQRDLKSSNNGYQAYKTERYNLKLASAEKMAELMKTDLEGITIAETKFTFKKIGVEEEERLAVEAIKDAERKAKQIAKEIGRKIGKIINIEDKSSGCCREIDSSNDKIAVKNYKVNVSFELND